MNKETKLFFVHKCCSKHSKTQHWSNKLITFTNYLNTQKRNHHKLLILNNLIFLFNLYLWLYYSVNLCEWFVCICIFYSEHLTPVLWHSAHCLTNVILFCCFQIVYEPCCTILNEVNMITVASEIKPLHCVSNESNRFSGVSVLR